MILIRKRTLLLAGFLALIAISITVAIIGARRFKPAQQDALGAASNTAGKFHAREIIDIQAEPPGVIIDLPIKESPASGPTAKGKVHYFADGYSLSDPASTNRQANWVCMFNPAKRGAQVKFTFYYEDSDPSHLAVEVPPETTRSINLYNCQEVLRNRRFGAKIESSEPMILQVCTAYYGEGDKADWYTRAMHSVICSNTISRVNYYADGFVIDVKKSRLKEPEWAFLLNPNPEAAMVNFYAYYAGGEKKIYALEIPPQRLFPLRMDDLVVKNKQFGAKYVSNVPIAIQQTRWVEEEDRKTIRAVFSVMAIPGELGTKP